MLVSIIIPTYNSQKTIEQCLSSVKRQTYEYIEVIVVDNHSIDATREIAQRYGKVYIVGPERSSQRNFGAQKAEGNFLLFVDSDMELEPRVVEECAKEALNKDVDAIVIPENSVGEGFWAQCKALERSCYFNNGLIEAARFLKKEPFFEVNGFDENLSAAEDWDLSLRLKKSGFCFSRIDAFIKHHEGRLSLSKTIKKKYKYGMNIGRYIGKNKKESKKQLMLIYHSFLKNYKSLLKKPIITTGLIFMKNCEFGAWLWGMFVSKCFNNKGLKI